MAGRPKKEGETITDDKISENNNSDSIILEELKKENDLLKKENEDVKSQIKLILQKLTEQESRNEKIESSNSVSLDASKNISYSDINPLKLIKVIP